MEVVGIMIIVILVNLSLDNLTHCYYCRKCKGNCKSCKDWSCQRQQYLNKNGDLKTNENK